MENIVQVHTTITKNVKHQIGKIKRGRVFTINDIKVEASSRQTIQRCLSRMVEQGLLQRVQKGIYYKPEISKFLKGKQIPPDVKKVIQVISTKNKEIIQLHGGAAANRLGLSTQVPMHQVFHTSGTTREMEISGTIVYFVHTNDAKLLQFSGTRAGLAISAMYYLGKNLVNNKVINQIKSRLTEQEFNRLRKAHLVSWMQKALQMAEDNI
jgi:predicted transcriptional regulator of viral defense system